MEIVKERKDNNELDHQHKWDKIGQITQSFCFSKRTTGLVYVCEICLEKRVIPV